MNTVKKLDKFVAIVGIAFLLVGSGLFIGGKFLPQQEQKHVVTSQQSKNETISYSGKAGKDALTLLQEKTTVMQDKSGLVITINNKKADATRHEYWAFYVNGKLAPVGPKEYKTKNTDMIEWKIEQY